MNRHQQKMVNEAAEKFAGALEEGYQTLADRSVSAQERNAQLTQEFLNGVINNLRSQAESNRALVDDLIEQQREQREASQALAQGASTPAWTSWIPCSPTTGVTWTRPRSGPTGRRGQHRRIRKARAGWPGPFFLMYASGRYKGRRKGELRQRQRER